VDIEDPAGKPRQRPWPELSQISRQDHEFDAMCGQGIGQARIGAAGIRLGGNVERRHAHLSSEPQRRRAPVVADEQAWLCVKFACEDGLDDRPRTASIYRREETKLKWL
jgi:hypothetical protein